MVGFALQAHLKLQGAVAHEDQMGMRINKTWHNDFTGSIEAFLVWKTRQHVVHRPDSLYQTITDQDGSLRN